MTKRLPCPLAPGPLEGYAAHFDDGVGTLAQRRGVREYGQGVLVPRDRHKTLTGLVGVEPVVGAQAASAQRWQFFVSESTWDAEAAHTPQEAARAVRWNSPDDPGGWTPVVRRVREGRQETWWAADLIYGPDGPAPARRVVVAATDPATLPPLTTWSLATNLPRPGAPHADAAPFAPADLPEGVRLDGLRTWVEQGYKHRKQERGWADFLSRSDQAIRRHWRLVLGACSCCWRAWFAATGPPTDTLPPSNTAETAPPSDSDAPSAPARGEHGVCADWPAAPNLLAADAPSRSRLAGSLDVPLALLARLVERAPAP